MRHVMIECPDCDEGGASHMAGPDANGPVRVVLAKHFNRDGRECAGSERVYVQGDELVAAAEEESASNRLGYYRVTVKRKGGAIVALFRGTVYRTKADFFSPMSASEV